MLKSHFIPKCIDSSRVVVSACQNVFRNLALEDWVFKNVQFDDKKAKGNHPELFIIWKNDPCLVVGRHQNVWSEVNVDLALKNGIDIARRRSGGGTVYHDQGNLNFTFFTSRNNYNRKRNLNFIVNHLMREFHLDVEVNSRDDLILNDMFKISGTAAKLGGHVAYHHFTLLVDANLTNARKLLHVSKEGIVSKATSSTSSAIANLAEFRPQVSTDMFIESFIKSYAFPNIVNLEDVYVDPHDEGKFPGIGDMANELQQWSWVYGHTPKFAVERDITPTGIHDPINLRFEVEKGFISKVDVETKDKEFVSKYQKLVPEAVRDLHGTVYCAKNLEKVLKNIPGNTSSDIVWLTRWLITSVINTLKS